MKKLIRVTIGLATVGLVFTAASSANAQAGDIVAPNGFENTEGGSNNRFPFLTNGGMRYQQLYESSHFGGIGSPKPIGGMAFRNDDGFGGAFDVDFDDVTIVLSTSSATEATISGNFATNTGGDATTVYSGPLNLSSGGAPLTFDITIDFQNNFVYDPTAGNLLVDIRVTDAGNNSINIFWDAENTTDGVARVFGPEGNPGATDGTPSNLGLITQFSFVPAPGALALLGLGALATRRRRR